MGGVCRNVQFRMLSKGFMMIFDGLGCTGMKVCNPRGRIPDQVAFADGEN